MGRTEFNADVSVIDTATNAVISSAIPVGLTPFGVAVTPDGSKVYVANQISNNVFVIDTASHLVLFKALVEQCRMALRNRAGEND